MSLPPGFHTLWPTPIGLHRHAAADEPNPLLARVLTALRATQRHAGGEAESAFFASDDDLLRRIQLPEWQAFVRFLVDGLRDTVTAADRGAWPAAGAGAGLALQVAIEGLWCQTSHRGTFHDVHTHGKAPGPVSMWCRSTSPRRARRSRSTARPTASPGCTARPSRRSAAPMSTSAMPTCSRRMWTSSRCPGSCCCFRPGWPTRPCPKDGERERIVIAFDASVHRHGGGGRLHAYAPR